MLIEDIIYNLSIHIRKSFIFFILLILVASSLFIFDKIYQNKIYPLNKPCPTIQEALTLAQKTDKLAIGLLYQQLTPSFHELVKTLKNQPLVDQAIQKIDITSLLKEFY